MHVSPVASWPVSADTSASKQSSVPAAPVPSNSAAHQKTKAVADVAAAAPTPEGVAQAVKQVNDAFAQKGQNLYAAIERDEASGITVVKVYDKDTKKEVRQFPPKAIVAMAEAIGRSIDGKVQLIHVSA